MVILLIAISHLIVGRFENALVDFLGASVVMSAVWCSHRGWFQVGAGIASLTLVGLSFFLGISGLVAVDRILPQLVLSMAIFIFVIEKYNLRMFFIFVSLLFSGVIFMNTETSLLHILTFVLQIAGFAVAFHYLVLFTERQDERLRESMKQLEDSHEAIESANAQLSVRNEELVAFAHIMSHDLKAPLTAIKSSAELMIEDRETQTGRADDLEMLGYIQTAATAMNSLISDILQYSKVNTSEALPLTLIDLDEVLKRVMEMFQLDVLAGRVVVDVENALPEIIGNEGTLRTVFQNLISNGMKYQPKDRPEHQPQIRIWSEGTDSFWELYCADNGIGIEEDFLEHVFTPFRRCHATGDYEGTGLGMSICKAIVSKHDGCIEVFETGETGTTFRVSFPKA